MALYGHIKKLTRKGGHYELRFDPAWFTSGVTASRAALEDTGSSDVPNDNYVVEGSPPADIPGSNERAGHRPHERRQGNLLDSDCGFRACADRQWR